MNNEENKVVVVTPFGLSERVDINRIVMQGENLAPLECAVQVDSFGKECMKKKKNLFLYRKNIEIPPLSMIGDLLCITECGSKSVQMNAVICAKTKMKKLQFGETKCFKIHVCKTSRLCPDLYIDTWKVKNVDQYETNDSSVEDINTSGISLQMTIKMMQQ